MSEKLQQVVAAIAEAQTRRRLFGNGGEPEAIVLARAAIEAMRSPTEAMVDAGYAFTADPCFREDFISAWNAAIDEALK